jgi:hypothetical protein
MILTYSSRIPVDSEYVKAIGTALYNFTYLEWIVIWTIFKLHAEGTQYNYRLPAGKIAQALRQSIENSVPPLSKALQTKLLGFHRSFNSALELRNRLLHAHPYSTPDGVQQLMNRKITFDITTVDDAALTFENVAIEGNEIFHGPLTQERP